MSFRFAKYLKLKLHIPVQNKGIETEAHCFSSTNVLENQKNSWQRCHKGGLEHPDN